MVATTNNPLTILPTGETSPRPQLCYDSGCALAKIGGGFTEVEIGSRYDSTRLLLIGEASGEAEAREALPFRPHAQSGSLLSDALREVNLSRADIAITNILRCRPPKDWLEGAPWQFSAISHCTTNYLYDVIRQLRPRVILALGGTAMRALTSTTKGRYGTVEFLRGYVLEGKGPAEGIPVVPGWHPSHLRRGMPHLTPHLYKDLKRAKQIALGGSLRGRHWAYDLREMGVRYQTQPSLEDAWEWAKAVDPTLPIVWDCETRDSTKTEEEDRTSFGSQDLVLVQFTQRRGEGIAIPYRDEYKEVVAYILGLPNDKVTHNGWAFDDEVAEQAGIEIRGQRLDAMCMFGFFYSDLPKNLQSAAQMCGFPTPWKHLGDSDLEFYGCADTDATLCEYQFMRELLEREGMWPSFLRYFARLWPILRDMSRRGIPIDEAKRAELKALILKEGERVDREVRELVPVEVLTTKQKNGYKRPPILQCEDCGWKGRGDHDCPGERAVDGGACDSDSGDDFPDPPVLGVDSDYPRRVAYKDLAEAHGLVQREVEIEEEEKCLCTKKLREQCPVCKGTGIVPVGYVDLRWAAPVAFNPNSSQQVKRYFRFRKYPIPSHAKRVDANGDPSETTEYKELQRLFVKTKDPVIPLLIEKRQLTKTEGTYHDGWAPWPDGRVRSTFGYGPPTMQTVSKNPNVQNGMKHGKTEFQKELVRKFNEMQKAPDGYCLVNFDFKSFHALMAAYEFGLPDYERLARIDIHSFITCQFLRLPECKGLWERDDQDMKGLFKFLRKGEKFAACRDVSAKQTILGIQLGRGPKSIHTMYQEYFDSFSQARQIWELVYSLFPKMKKGQEKEIDEAFENKRIVSRFGALRHFWDVKRWSRKEQKWVHGDQAEQAMSYRIQTHSFGHYREFLLTLRENGWDEKYGLINQIHDSAQFLCPLQLREECVANVRPIMERESDILIYPQMGKFRAEAEAQWGESMADLHN